VLHFPFLATRPLVAVNRAGNAFSKRFSRVTPDVDRIQDAPPVRARRADRTPLAQAG
jgi:hypothetical protein